VAERVHRLVLATKHNARPPSPDAALLVDVDLAILLEAFLARPHFYSTDYFRSRYEVSARANLARSIERLGG
jgi:predicted metal-dependent HD superfamily phosphohydrolase